MSKTSCRAIIAAAVLAAGTVWAAAPAGAENCYWLYAWDDNWSSTWAWDPHVPSAADAAIINNEGRAWIWADEVCQSLRLGESGDGSTFDCGSVFMEGGGLSAGDEYVGVSGLGWITQIAGVNAVTGDLYLGQDFFGAGFYELGDTGQMTCRDLYVGYDGAGRFTQEAGIAGVSQTVYLGCGASGDGAYVLSGPGSFTADVLVVGRAGIGDFSQSAGTSTVTTELNIGAESGGSGTYRLSGGTLQVGTGVRVGADGGEGRLEWFADGLTAPSVLVGTNGTLAMGFDFDIGLLLDGTLNSGSAPAGLTDGSLEITNGATAGHNAGSHELGHLVLGGEAGSGAYALSGTGALTGDTVTVGCSDVGEFTQTGGVANVGTLSLGAEFWGAGVYRLSGAGTLSVLDDLRIGADGGEGRLEWFADALTASRITMGGGGTLALGFDFNAANLLSGALSHGEAPDGLEYGALEVTNGATGTLNGSGMVLGFLTIGSASGAGTFNQTAGTGDVVSISLGRDAGSSGTYSLSGSASLVAEEVCVGDGGTGLLAHSGGALTITDRLIVGYDGDGTVLISAPAVLVAPGEYVGEYGQGSVVQTGGSNTAEELLLGWAEGSQGSYELSGGELTVGNLVVGVGGNGTLHLSSPSSGVTIANLLRFGPNGSFTCVPGGGIHMTGSALDIQNIDPADLAGLENLTLIFEGGPADTDAVEAAGQDMGAVSGGWVGNFALGTLQIGGVSPGNIRLVNARDNQPGWVGAEAMYVNWLVLNAGAKIDLNGLNLYYLNGGPAKQFLVGDASLDGRVDGGDYTLWADNYGQPGAWGDGDFNGDGVADGGDYTLWADNYGAGGGAAVPEPGVLSALAAGALALIRRRR